MTVNDDKTLTIERGQRLKRLRNIANLSRKELEQQFNIKLNTLKGWEVGRHGGLTKKGALQMLQILETKGVHCELSWLMFGKGKGPVLTKRFYKEEATTISNATYNEDQQIIQELLCFRRGSDLAIDMIVNDNSMEPYYHKGDLVAGIKRYEEKIAELCGHDCIVETDTGEVLLRFLHKLQENGTYTLRAHNFDTAVNKPVLYDIMLVSAAPVIWLRRKNP